MKENFVLPPPTHCW